MKSRSRLLQQYCSVLIAIANASVGDIEIPTHRQYCCNIGHSRVLGGPTGTVRLRFRPDTAEYRQEGER